MAMMMLTNSLRFTLSLSRTRCSETSQQPNKAARSSAVSERGEGMKGGAAVQKGGGGKQRATNTTHPIPSALLASLDTIQQTNNTTHNNTTQSKPTQHNTTQHNESERVPRAGRAGGPPVGTGGRLLWGLLHRLRLRRRQHWGWRWHWGWCHWGWWWQRHCWQRRPPPGLCGRGRAGALSAVRGRRWGVCCDAACLSELFFLCIGWHASGWTETKRWCCELFVNKEKHKCAKQKKLYVGFGV